MGSVGLPSNKTARGGQMALPAKPVRGTSLLARPRHNTIYIVHGLVVEGRETGEEEEEGGAVPAAGVEGGGGSGAGSRREGAERR